MDEQRIAEIRERLSKATPGPWGTYKDATLDGTIVWRIGSNATGEDIGTVIHNRDLDAWLVANAPTDLADLLAEREKLLADNAQLRTLLPTAKCDCGHSRSRHKDCDDRDECVECICSELRFGETE